VQSLCADLTKAGLGSLSVTVGEYLTCPQERIVTASAQELAQQSFAPLSLLLAQAAPRAQVSVPGIPDAAFLRGNVPMTKQEIRCIIPSRLSLRREDVCWDIGAGTGSVSVELALQCRAVWAVEQKEEAVALIGQNRQRFCAWNLRTVCAKAPSALEQLPDPDAVFIGGSGGELEGILSAALSRNPAVRLCISAVTLETLHSAVPLLQAAGISPEISQISAARTRAAGASHLLTAQNPVFLISGAAR
jgi:precorrin-6Y C5,15-methyltransferase (decarboxylating)